MGIREQSHISRLARLDRIVFSHSPALVWVRVCLGVQADWSRPVLSGMGPCGQLRRPVWGSGIHRRKPAGLRLAVCVIPRVGGVDFSVLGGPKPDSICYHWRMLGPTHAGMSSKELLSGDSDWRPGPTDLASRGLQFSDFRNSRTVVTRCSLAAANTASHSAIVSRLSRPLISGSVPSSKAQSN